MEKIERKIKGFFGAATAFSVMMIVIGAIFALMPGFAINAMRIFLTLALIISGVVMICRDIERGGSAGIFSSMIIGVFQVIMGLIIWLYPETFMIVAIVFGIYMILSGVGNLNVAGRIRESAPNAYTWTVISSIISVICGLIMICRPGGSMEVMVMIAGIVMIVYGISGTVDALVLRARFEDFSATVKTAGKKAKNLLDAEEAEIVEDKPKAKKSAAKKGKK